MKTLLYINACMREQSRTEKLCRRYIEHLIRNEVFDIKEVKLSEQELKPFNHTMLEKRNADMENQSFNDSDYQFAKDFASADFIVIAAPLWDCSFPSVLKVYFEHICVNGITFGYTADGKPLSLCHAEKLVYISTAGGYIKKNNSVKLYMEELCDMFGIENRNCFIADGMDIVGNDTEKILNKTYKLMCG